jgi:hypothetical protein
MIFLAKSESFDKQISNPAYAIFGPGYTRHNVSFKILTS